MAQFILPLGNGGFRTHKYCMLRPTVVRTVLNWVKSLVLALGGYLLFTTGASILVTALYYWLLLIVNDEAWAQISLTGAAVVAGLVVARYVYVRNRSHLPSEKNLRKAATAVQRYSGRTRRHFVVFGNRLLDGMCRISDGD